MIFEGSGGGKKISLKEGLMNLLDRLPIQSQMPDYFPDDHKLTKLKDIVSQSPGDPLVKIHHLHLLDHIPKGGTSEGSVGDGDKGSGIQETSKRLRSRIVR